MCTGPSVEKPAGIHSCNSSATTPCPAAAPVSPAQGPSRRLPGSTRRHHRCPRAPTQCSACRSSARAAWRPKAARPLPASPFRAASRAPPPAVRPADCRPPCDGRLASVCRQSTVRPRCRAPPCPRVRRRAGTHGPSSGRRIRDRPGTDYRHPLETAPRQRPARKKVALQAFRIRFWMQNQVNLKSHRSGTRIGLSAMSIAHTSLSDASAEAPAYEPMDVGTAAPFPSRSPVQR
ncbi:hypothetical protein OKW39_004548 [Paraburkholderia sp. MM6662-R1]